MQTIDFNAVIPIFRGISEEAKVPFGLVQAQRKINVGSLRVEEIDSFIPHAHATHLETKDHLNTTDLKDKLSFKLNAPLLTKIISEDQQHLEFDEGIQFAILKKANPKMIGFDGFPMRLIQEVIEKYPNLILIGINEPSFDPESDGAAVFSHKMAFYYNKMLIELLDLSQIVEESSLYYCLLNIFRFTDVTDAYPCSPVLYKPLILPAFPKAFDSMALSDSCLFCKIIRGVIPSFKIYETNLTFAFLDINPLSEGHILVIPKFHGGKLHEITDEHLADILPVARKILLEGFGENGATMIPAYNILQNNGRLAHQEVDHVHFHIIPKRNEEEGLGIKWPAQPGNMATLSKYADSIRSKIIQ